MQIVNLGFDKFQAYIGPGTSAADRSKSCNLILTLKYPPAYSFAVVSSTYHGYAQLDSGVAGKFSSAYILHVALRRHVQHEHQRTGRCLAGVRICLLKERHDLDAQLGPQPVWYLGDRLVGFAQHREHNLSE
jgi:hypothetical protein